jgi:hypothetical protein
MERPNVFPNRGAAEARRWILQWTAIETYLLFGAGAGSIPDHYWRTTPDGRLLDFDVIERDFERLLSEASTKLELGVSNGSGYQTTTSWEICVVPRD